MMRSEKNGTLGWKRWRLLGAVALSVAVLSVGGEGIAQASPHRSSVIKAAVMSAPGTYALHPGTLEGKTLTLTGGPTSGNLTYTGGNTGFWFLDGKQITIVIQSGPAAGLVFEGKLKSKGINTATKPGLVAAPGFGVGTWYGLKG